MTFCRTLADHLTARGLASSAGSASERHSHGSTATRTRSLTRCDSMFSPSAANRRCESLWTSLMACAADAPSPLPSMMARSAWRAAPMNRMAVPAQRTHRTQTQKSHKHINHTITSASIHPAIYPSPSQPASQLSISPMTTQRNHASEDVSVLPRPRTARNHNTASVCSTGTLPLWWWSLFFATYQLVCRRSGVSVGATGLAPCVGRRA